MSRFSFGLAWANCVGSVSKVKYDLEPAVRDRSPAMDAFAKRIHGNKAFSLENVAKAVEDALAKKEAKS